MQYRGVQYHHTLVFGIADLDLGNVKHLDCNFINIVLT